MAKLCVQLSGGLGNQMFQYATGRALSLKHGLDLAIDNWSGFVRDVQYQRTYQLSELPIKQQLVKFCDQIPLWLCRMENYLSKNEGRFLQKKFYGDFYIESDFVYHHSLYEARFSRLTWLIGYWQSPLYFQGHKELLMAELMPNSPTSVHYHELATKMKSSDSVALGIRLYEESKNPSDHARGGRIKTISEINLAIDRLLAYRKKAKFFVFCTHKSGLLQKLRLPRDTIFVTPAEGYQDAIACMWLLSNCRHHIMTNSSYYWWGAWLSGAHYSEKDQVILAADNFNNVDGLCNNWQKF